MCSYGDLCGNFTHAYGTHCRLKLPAKMEMDGSIRQYHIASASIMYMRRRQKKRRDIAANSIKSRSVNKETVSEFERSPSKETLSVHVSTVARIGQSIRSKTRDNMPRLFCTVSRYACCTVYLRFFIIQPCKHRVLLHTSVLP